jgi:hypothetical protein
MPISFVGAGAVAVGNAPTVAVPAGVVAGDALLLFVTTAGVAPTAPTNWTVISSSPTESLIYFKIATSSETSLTLNNIGNGGLSVMLAYRGVGYVDVIGTPTTASSSAATPNSVTTRFANDWIISFYTNNPLNGASWTTPASTTQRAIQASTGTIRGLLLVDEAQAVAGASAARTSTLPSAITYTVRAIALKEPQAFYVDPENGNDANNGQTFATALKNISGATAAKAIQPGDTVRVKEAPLYNTGVNATWTSVQQRGISPFNNHSMNSATNATPIVCSTALAHGYSTGDVVAIANNTGNTAANGIWEVTVINSTSFSLNDSSGNANTISPGVIIPMFCRVIKTATPLVKPIASFANLKSVSSGTRATWVGSANVTTSFISSFGSLSKGNTADSISINSSFTTGKIAYYTLPATLDLSAYQQLSLFINQNNGATSGGLTISLCSDTTGDTAVDTFTIPATSTAGVFCPFTINKGSALGSSIRSISISRAANNGTQTFYFNSIVAVKSPTSVDALSNTSLFTKNNGTEGAYAVGGFAGIDGAIVILENRPTGDTLTITGGAYYGTTETASLWRYEPFNPYTLNGAALPASAPTSTTYNVFSSNSGSSLSIPITYSGGWDSTNMSTRTGQTWFSNQNGLGTGLRNNNNTNYITVDRINYTRSNIGFLGDSSSVGCVIQNCNYTATNSFGISMTTTSQQQLQNCIVTNTNSYGGNIINGSNDINNPNVINNCTFSGNVTYSLFINTSGSGYPYYTITNSSFNTSSSTGIITGWFGYATITSNSINYFNTTGFNPLSNIVGTINNLTFVPEPAGGSSIIAATVNQTYTLLPQNIYTTFNNVTVNAPTTTYSQGTTNFSYLLEGGASNFKFLNCSFTPTNVVYTLGNQLNSLGGAYFYNCTGVPTTINALSLIIAPYILNAAHYSQDEGNTVGNNKIYFQGGLGTSQTAVRNTPSGYAWSLAPTSTTLVTSQFPLKLKIASVAANGGSAVTISAYMRRTNTGLTMQLVCPANQPYGPTSDTVASMTAAANTWEQVSISFTPTQNGVYDIYAYAFGGTTFTGYVDDVGVTQ